MAQEECGRCGVGRVLQESASRITHDHREGPKRLPLSVYLDWTEMKPVDLSLFPRFRLVSQFGGNRLVTFHRPYEFLDKGVFSVIA